MGRIKTHGEDTFKQVVAEAAEEVASVAQEARGLIASVMPGVTEVVWLKQKTIGYGVGPQKMSEHFCYLALNKAHVNLGFFYGADLEDPDRLLEGTGKLLRHVKLRSVDDVTRPAIRSLVEQASRHLPKL